MAGILLLTACADQSVPLSTAPGAPTTTAARNSAFANSSQEVPPRVRGEKQNFVGMPDDSLWAYLRDANGKALVGLKMPGENRGIYQGRVLVTASATNCEPADPNCAV